MRPGSTRRQRRTPTGWRLPLALAVAVLLLIGLVWLARREERQPVPPDTKPPLVQTDSLPLVRERVEAFLAGSGIPAEAISREPPAAPRVYRIRQRMPATRTVARLRQELRRLAPPLELATPEDGVLAIVDHAGKPLATLQFLPPAPRVAGKQITPGSGGRVAIIVDDLGRSEKQARTLLALKQPVTLAILPGEPHATTIANATHAAGREVMLHVPMEPQGYPVVDPGDDALLVGQNDAELLSRLHAQLARVPHAVGVNNHMGSRFTEEERGMAVVMGVLRERGLFFVDSLTSSHSVGSKVAESAGVPVVRRDLFLDNVAEVDAIVGELGRLAEKARRNGSALAICHPYPETLVALQQELPRLAAQGIEFISVAQLVKESP